MRLLNIEATAPETGYGWIHAGDPLKGRPEASQIAEFVEKPDAATAERLVRDGSWNRLGARLGALRRGLLSPAT